MIGNGGHKRHLIAEGCDPGANLIAIGNNQDRKKEATALAHVHRWEKFVSVRAIVYPFTEDIGEGCQIMAGAVIHAPLGKHVIVGNNAVVSHDCEIGDFAFIGPGAVICGGARIGTGAFIGAGAVVVPGAVVPAWALVKAGERI